MASNRDNLGLMFGLISLVSSASDSLQHFLRGLPAQILAWIIVLAIAWYAINHVFKFLFKNEQPIQLGSIKLSYATVFSVPSMILVVILLLL